MVTTAAPLTQPAIATIGAGWRAGQAQILSDITLAVNEGEFLSIIGPNGAGKSTFINLLAGQIRPSAGRVEIGGEDVSKLSPAARVRAGVGRSYQVASLFPDLTVLENARLAAQISAGGALSLWKRPRRTDEASVTALGVLEEVGLASMADHKAASLSHGSKKKLDIAAALCTSPKVILLDEPTAGVSMEDLDDLIGVVRGLNARGVTVIMVEHHMDIVTGLSDRIAVLQGGRLLLCDVPEKVISSEVVKTAYLGVGEG